VTAGGGHADVWRARTPHGEFRAHAIQPRILGVTAAILDGTERVIRFRDPGGARRPADRDLALRGVVVTHVGTHKFADRCRGRLEGEPPGNVGLGGNAAHAAAPVLQQAVVGQHGSRSASRQALGFQCVVQP